MLFMTLVGWLYWYTIDTICSEDFVIFLKTASPGGLSHSEPIGHLVPWKLWLWVETEIRAHLDERSTGRPWAQCHNHSEMTCKPKNNGCLILVESLNTLDIIGLKIVQISFIPFYRVTVFWLDLPSQAGLECLSPNSGFTWDINLNANQQFFPPHMQQQKNKERPLGEIAPPSPTHLSY